MATKKLTHREGRCRVVYCPRCGVNRDEPCITALGKQAKRAHRERWDEYENFVAESYCQNESQSGYPCGRKNCPNCFGATQEQWNRTHGDNRQGQDRTADTVGQGDPKGTTHADAVAHARCAGP